MHDDRCDFRGESFDKLAYGRAVLSRECVRELLLRSSRQFRIKEVDVLKAQPEYVSKAREFGWWAFWCYDGNDRNRWQFRQSLGVRTR